MVGVRVRCCWRSGRERDEPQAVVWAVYYAERGLRSGERLFVTEHDACSYLLDVVLKDPTTRRSRWPKKQAVVGPDMPVIERMRGAAPRGWWRSRPALRQLLRVLRHPDGEPRE